MQFKPLETQRLCLRPMAEADRPHMEELLLEDTIFGILGNATLARNAAAAAWREITGPGILNVSLFLRDGSFAGRICLQELDSGEPELGVALPGKYRRQGLGPEAVRAFANWYGAESGETRLWLCIEESNAPSLHMFSALGAVETEPRPPRDGESLSRRVKRFVLPLPL